MKRREDRRVQKAQKENENEEQEEHVQVEVEEQQDEDGGDGEWILLRLLLAMWADRECL